VALSETDAAPVTRIKDARATPLQDMLDSLE
jgi:hypothetical protein